MICKVLSWLWLRAESDTASQLLLMWQQGWGKQVVVTVAAAIAVEDNDAHDIMDQTEIEIIDLIEYKAFANI